MWGDVLIAQRIWISRSVGFISGASLRGRRLWMVPLIMGLSAGFWCWNATYDEEPFEYAAERFNVILDTGASIYGTAENTALVMLVGFVILLVGLGMSIRLSCLADSYIVVAPWSHAELPVSNTSSTPPVAIVDLTPYAVAYVRPMSEGQSFSPNVGPADRPSAPSLPDDDGVASGASSDTDLDDSNEAQEAHRICYAHLM